MRRLSLTLACALSYVAFARAAACATEEPIVAELTLTRDAGSESCIDATTLKREVERRLGRSVFRPPKTDAKVHVRISGKSGEWRALLELATPDDETVGKRELVAAGKRCEELDDPLALVLAIMLDVSKQEIAAQAGQSEIGTLPPKTEEPRTAPDRDAKDSTRLSLPSEPVRAVPWGFSVGAGAGLSIGRQPDVAPGLDVWGELEPPRFWAFGVRGSLHAPTSVTRHDAAVDFVSRRIGFFVCPLMFGSDKLQVGGCAEYGLGSLNVSAHGFAFNRNETRALPEIGARLVARLTLTAPLELTGSLGGFAVLQRDRFTYRAGTGETVALFRPAPVALAVEIGLALRSR